VQRLHVLESAAEVLRRARALATGLAGLDGIDIDPSDVHSNIVRFTVTEGGAADFAERCHAAGVHMIPGGGSGVRAVVHRDIDDGAIERAIELIAGAASSRSRVTRSPARAGGRAPQNSGR